MTDGTTPLIALDAAVIDTETTGLDPRSARVVELATVRIVGGRLDGASFRRLIHPGEPIPPAAAAVHGIDAATVADAPSFAKVWPEFLAALGDAVVIGHTVGFDLAVLKSECERAGLAWRPPQTLDTRLLAEVAEPELAGFSLESLASWLGVDVTDRHSALGDALRPRAYFARCVPKLRERGIRTLAEAARACRALTSGAGRATSRRLDRGGAAATDDAERTARASTAIPIVIASATSWRRRDSSRRSHHRRRPCRHDT